MYLSITINLSLYCSSFRDLIKDVHVTLTPLTDFEKEIEKSSKRVSLIAVLFTSALPPGVRYTCTFPINSSINNSHRKLLSDFDTLFVEFSSLTLLSRTLAHLLLPLNNGLIISYTCLQLVKCQSTISAAVIHLSPSRNRIS